MIRSYEITLAEQRGVSQSMGHRDRKMGVGNWRIQGHDEGESPIYVRRVGSSGYFRQLYKRPFAGFPFPHFYGFADGDPSLQLSFLPRKTRHAATVSSNDPMIYRVPRKGTKVKGGRSSKTAVVGI